MTPEEAYEQVHDLYRENAPLELEQHDLNALAMHDLARVSLFAATPPLVAEVEVKFPVHGAHVVRRIVPPASRPEPVRYEHRGLMCEAHGQAAHRRERFATGPWTCCECSPSEAT